MEKSIYDLEGFEDICNENELMSANAGCSDFMNTVGRINLPTIPTK